MQITEIKQQVRNKERYAVFVDGEYAFSLIQQDILYFKLREGEMLPREKYDYIMENLIYIKAQEAALHFLGYRARTKKEVSEKLGEKEYAPEVIQKVLLFLEKYGYLDDEVYARAYVRDSIKLKPKGRFLLRMELAQKGVNDETIQRVLEEELIDEMEGAKRLIRKKVKDFSAVDEKKKNSVFAALQRKGYSFELTKEAFLECSREAEES